MFSASDLADWFDEHQEKLYQQQDDWLIETHNLGDAHPALVFCSWFGDRTATAPKRLMDWMVGSIVDVLRLGCDIDTESDWGIAKGAFLNVSRLAVVAGPAAEGLAVGSRYAGMMGTALLDGLAGVSKPCRFVATNNAVSFVAGKKVQLFSALDDLIKTVRPGKPGANMVDEILKHPSVEPLIKKAGVVWSELGNFPTLQHAFAKAREVEGAIVVGVEWTNSTGKHAHRITLVKDALGKLKILDYSQGAAFKGFSTLREMAARGGAFRGFENAVIRPGALLFQSKKIKFLEAANDVFHIGIPVAMGIGWGKGKSIDTAAAEIVTSFWKYAASKLGLSAPPPPPELPDLTTNPNEWTTTILGKPPYWYTVRQGIPKEDWISSRAGKEYGDTLLWPLIFEATREEESKNGGIKFVNQNKMWPGQRVFVPDISSISAEKKAAARKRGMDWQRVG